MFRTKYSGLIQILKIYDSLWVMSGRPYDFATKMPPAVDEISDFAPGCAALGRKFSRPGPISKNQVWRKMPPI